MAKYNKEPTGAQLQAKNAAMMTAERNCLHAVDAFIKDTNRL